MGATARRTAGAPSLTADGTLERMTLRIAVALTSALLLLSGCGGSSDDRPSATELAASLRKGSDLLGQDVSFSKAEAACIAKVLERSKMSDEALRAIADKKTDYDASEKDKDVAAGLDTASCVERPSVAEVSKAFQAGVASASNSSSVLKLPKAQADCVAGVLVDKSKLSNADLYEVVSAHTLETGADNAKLVQAVQKDLTACGS